MNYRLAKEIYGQAWFMDSESWQRYAPMLQNGADFGVPENNVKDNNVFFVESATKVFDNNNIQSIEKLERNKKYISVVNLNGAITTNGGASHNGTKQIAMLMQTADNEKNVIGHIIQINSGGGAADAVIELTEVMQALNKPIVSFIDGMAASAAYYIASYSNTIIAKRGTNKVGSIGVMLQYQGFPKQAEVASGERVVRIYANQSYLKNQPFEEAINNFNFQPAIEKILNPMAAQFINDVKANRINVNEDQLSGDIFTAAEVVGTLIDSIGSFESAVKKVEELSSQLKINSIMTKEELKQAHPELYASVLQEGAINERDRVEAILTYVDVDATACTELVKAGTNPSQKFYAEMNRKALANDMINAAQTEAVPTIETPAETKAETTNDADAEFELALKQASEAANLSTK